MPYYEYRCKDCGKRFMVKETFEEHDEHRRITCPKCESHSADRVITEVFAQTAKKS